MTSNVSQVTLEGDEKELDKIKSLEVPVDVSDVSGNIIKKVNIQVPDGIKLVSAPTINVTIRTGEKVNNVREETNEQNEEVIESSEKKQQTQTQRLKITQLMKQQRLIVKLKIKKLIHPQKQRNNKL